MMSPKQARRMAAKARRKWSVLYRRRGVCEAEERAHALMEERAKRYMALTGREGPHWTWDFDLLPKKYGGLA